MVLKIFLFARDKPAWFFLMAIPLAILLIGLAIFVFSIIFESILKPMNADNNTVLIVLMAVYLPITPIIFLVFIIFIESYLNFFRMAWLFNLENRKIVNGLVNWATERQNNIVMRERKIDGR